MLHLGASPVRGIRRTMRPTELKVQHKLTCIVNSQGHHVLSVGAARLVEAKKRENSSVVTELRHREGV